MVIMTDSESIQKVTPENCDRLNKRLDCVMSSTKTPQAIPNLISSDINLREDNGLESKSTLGEGNGMASDAATNTIAIVELDNFSESSKGSSVKMNVEPISSSDKSHPDPTMPASLDCIRVLSSTGSVKSEERSASARSTRKAKKTRKQAKRFGFWVLSKIFV